MTFNKQTAIGSQLMAAPFLCITSSLLQFAYKLAFYIICQYTLHDSTLVAANTTVNKALEC